MSAANDLVGQRFGRLVVVERMPSNNKGNSVWKCLCDCGNESVVVGYSLTCGTSHSCGCLHHEKIIETNIRTKRTHGLKQTRLYRIWSGMKGRCNQPNNKDYRLYGGRGISVCDEWQNSFVSFYEWAMQSGYSDSLTIDRINTNGNYEPSNCRWATYSEQNANRRPYRRKKR